MSETRTTAELATAVLEAGKRASETEREIRALLLGLRNSQALAEARRGRASMAEDLPSEKHSEGARDAYEHAADLLQSLLTRVTR